MNYPWPSLSFFNLVVALESISCRDTAPMGETSMSLSALLGAAGPIEQGQYAEHDCDRKMTGHILTQARAWPVQSIVEPGKASMCAEIR